MQGVPNETHVSRVEASPFDAGTAYVTFDGHRTDDHKPHVFVTKDFGETWTSIASNLPTGNANVDHGGQPEPQPAVPRHRSTRSIVSIDAGQSWKPLMQGLPTVRIDDLIIHPRERDLIVGTHGRSIWILDDISPLEQMTDQTMTHRRGALRRPAGDGVGQRHPEADHRRRREELPRRRTRIRARRSATG